VRTIGSVTPWSTYSIPFWKPSVVDSVPDCWMLLYNGHSGAPPVAIATGFCKHVKGGSGGGDGGGGDGGGEGGGGEGGGEGGGGEGSGEGGGD
jgi:hypothetical protein